METVVRVVVVYLFVLVSLRIMGKREFGQLAPMELIALLLVPEIVSQSLVGNDYSLTNGFVALSTLLALVFANSLLSHLSKGFEKVSEGEPAVLAHHGKLVQANLNRERISPSELYAEMRKSGLERLDQVRWAVLETDGKISIVPVEPGESVQRKAGKGPL
ncbi:MAG TPA: YetF domain-containing protein [Trueperaceae bacterium]